MGAFKNAMKVVEGLLGTRACLLLVLVFVSSIDRSSPSGAAPESTSGAPPFRHPGNLTKEQLNLTVTIEFDFRRIGRQNRTALNAAYREVRRKILERLNRKTSTIVPPTQPTHTTTSAPSVTTTSTTTSTTTTPTTPTTPITTTSTTPTTTAAALTTTPTTSVVETTTETSTTIAATTLTTQATTTTPIISTASSTLRQTPGPAKRKRRKRSPTSGENNITFTDEDLSSIEIQEEFDENGNLRMTFLLDRKELAGIDLGELLYEAVKELNETGDFEDVARVVRIYKGPPPPLPTSLLTTEMPTTGMPTTGLPSMESWGLADFRVWLPILLAIILLLIIFIFVFCWKAKHKKVKKDADRQKIVPTLDSKPDSLNGHGPRILDDNSGWLVPYEHFSNEQR